MKVLSSLILLIALFVFPLAAQEPRSPQEPKVPPEAKKIQRAHFVVRNADPVILAEIVGKHFKGDAELLATPAGSGNAILISGSPAILPEVLSLLEKLDRKPRTIEVEVTLAEVPAKKEGTELTPADLATIETVVKAGQGQRIKLTAVEGQPVTTTTGGANR